MSIFTVRYNQTTIFFLFFFFNFLNVIFFIKNQFLSKSAFVTEENNLFFGMRSPEPLATKSLASADSPLGNPPLFLPLENSITKKRKVYCLEYLMCVLKTD